MTDQSSAGDATSPSSDPAASATPGGQSNPTDATSSGADKGATPDTSLGGAGTAALDKERGARREAERQVAQFRDRIAELEDAGKTESERLASQLRRAQADLDARTARVTELEGEIAKRDLVELQRQVAAELELPLSMAPRLHGTDLRSLRADAKAMAEELQAGTPAGQIGIGRGGAAAGSSRRVDMNALIREAAGR